MKKLLFFIFSFIFIQSSYSQTIKYSPAWFGPNANPVPEFTDARIPAKTTLSLMADAYFGFGDQTQNGYFKAEVPLLAERVSLKVWSVFFEYYRVSDQVSNFREMNGKTSGKIAGDFYVQTRISILNERKHSIDIIECNAENSFGNTCYRQAILRYAGLLFRYRNRKIHLYKSAVYQRNKRRCQFGFSLLGND